MARDGLTGRCAAPRPPRAPRPVPDPRRSPGPTTRPCTGRAVRRSAHGLRWRVEAPVTTSPPPRPGRPAAPGSRAVAGTGHAAGAARTAGAPDPPGCTAGSHRPSARARPAPAPRETAAWTGSPQGSPGPGPPGRPRSACWARARPPGAMARRVAAGLAPPLGPTRPGAAVLPVSWELVHRHALRAVRRTDRPEGV